MKRIIGILSMALVLTGCATNSTEQPIESPSPTPSAERTFTEAETHFYGLVVSFEKSVLDTTPTTVIDYGHLVCEFKKADDQKSLAELRDENYDVYAAAIMALDVEGFCK